MRKFRIAHISDLHISAEHRRGNIRRTKALLRYVAEQGFDHLVITGDLTADAQKKDYEFVRHLLAAHDLLDPQRLSLVIGNHDIFGGVHDAEDVLTYPKRCKRTDYHRKLTMFTEYFREAFKDVYRVHPEDMFPYAKVLGDVVLFGSNSIAEYSKIGNPVGSNGEVSPKELSHLRRLLADPNLADKRKIMLIHHHFHKMEKATQGTMHSLWEAMERQTMKLRGRKELLTMFREANIEIVLHGHVHENREYFRKGVRFLNGGGAVIDRYSPDPKVNFVTVTADGIQTEMHRVPVDTSFVRSGRVVLEPLITNLTAA